MEVAVLDISDFILDTGGGDMAERHRELLSQWDRAFIEHGFCHITGHFCPEDVVSNLRSAASSFFSQKSSVKLRSFANQGYGSAGGYTPCGIEAVGQSTALDETDSPALPPDLVEALVFNRLDGSDVYPECVPELREAVDVYKSHMIRILDTLMRISALALGREPNFFTKYYEKNPMRSLKLAHYPTPSVVKSNIGQPRYGAHTDYIGFTILKQDDSCGGLEALIGDSWTPIPPVKGAFTINSADLISLWTGGRWKSPLHRVAQVPDAKSRLSIVYFTGPDSEVVVEPIGGQGEKVIAGEYLKKKLIAGNRDNGRSIGTK